jgi:FkbM family methyltransferase
MNEVPKESLVVSSVIFVEPVTALNRLRDHGFNCLDYFSFAKYSGLSLKEILFLSEAKEDLERNWSKYINVCDRLEDECSKYILGRLINFRFSYDLEYMQGFKFSPEQQYFEDFLELKAGEIFVDAGGFDGQTVKNFIKKCPDYRSVYVFEPDPVNVAVCRKNLTGYRDIYFYIMGLGQGTQTLRFNSGEGSASKVSETGDIEISVDSIDNVIKEPVTMIKMDIEGAERVAIKGASMHILNDHPRLAICCYHKHDDLWKIPQEVLDLRNDYSLYLRHYTDGLHETVMYFIPKTA